MGSSRALLLLSSSLSPFQFRRFTHHTAHLTLPNCSAKPTSNDTASSLPPPHVPHLAQTARISLSPQQAEQFAPQIRQVIDWFGQLQAVDLESVEPALRADTEGDNLRDDIPLTFENREAIISGIPSYEEPFIKVPQVLNKD